MALDFSGIKDEPGAAIYCVTADGPAGRRVGELAEHLTGKTRQQVVVIDSMSPAGAQVVTFYGLTREHLPCVLIVRDNDEIAFGWYGQDVPSPDIVVRQAESIG